MIDINVEQLLSLKMEEEKDKETSVDEMNHEHDTDSTIHSPVNKKKRLTFFVSTRRILWQYSLLT